MIDIEIDIERLRSIGLTPQLATHVARELSGFAAPQGTPLQLMRLVEVHRETVRVHDGIEDVSARVLPRLARSLAEHDTGLAVGDWMLVQREQHGQWWVHEQVPPLSHLARRDADGRRHPVVSNVDTALLVMGLDADFNLRRLERYLMLVHGSGMLGVVVLTKADLAGATAGAIDAALARVHARIPPGMDAMAVDARAERSATALAPYLAPGQTVVVLGSSGAGKSTLTNTMLGSHVQDTGAVREHDDRGKHTTTSRSLHQLPGGACVIDTPGLRALRPDIDEHRLSAGFADIEALAAACRFRDCRHQDEPGCAVRSGVPGDRLRNYQKLLREARRDTMGALERQRQTALWKARGRAAELRMRVKRGE